jgi:putative addiction module killer protein
LRSVPKKLLEYVDADGRNPFREWLNRLKDRKAQVAIDARLTRVRMGNLGLCRSVGKGVFELKVDLGPGYRVYFGEAGSTLVILLLGGDKRTQSSDIKQAQKYWEDYRGRKL